MATVAPGVPTGPYHAVLDHIHPEPTSFIRKYIFSIDAKVIGDIPFRNASEAVTIILSLGALAIRSAVM